MDLKKRKLPKYNLRSPEFNRHTVSRSEDFWFSSDGKKILIKDLDKNHIFNIISKFKRGGYTDKDSSDFVGKLKMEVEYRSIIKNI